MPWDPNAVIPVILIVIVRRIRSVMVVSNRWRRGYKNKRWPNKNPKAGMTMVVSISVSMSGPG
jgi:hypothetical protein